VLPTRARRQALPSYLSFVFQAPISMQGAFHQPYMFFKMLGWIVAIRTSHCPMILTIELQKPTRKTLKITLTTTLT